MKAFKHFAEEGDVEAFLSMHLLDWRGFLKSEIFLDASVTVMAIGLLPMPYGYYNLVRLVCGSAIFFAHNSFQKVILVCLDFWCISGALQSYPTNPPIWKRNLTSWILSQAYVSLLNEINKQKLAAFHCFKI